VQQPSNIPNNDEHNIRTINHKKPYTGLHGQYFHLRSNKKTTTQDYKRSTQNTPRARLISQTQEMLIRQITTLLSWIHHLS